MQSPTKRPLIGVPNKPVAEATWAGATFTRVLRLQNDSEAKPLPVEQAKVQSESQKSFIYAGWPNQKSGFHSGPDVYRKKIK